MNLSTTAALAIRGLLANRPSLLACQQARLAMTLSDLKINWVRPKKLSFMDPAKTGDLGVTVDVKPTEYRDYFGECKELETADEFVKRMFTLEFGPQKETAMRRREKFMDLVRRHKDDTISMEARIAMMTNEIQYLSPIFVKNPGNKMVKIHLKHLIDKRKKYLKILRRWDYKRFEWLLERLNLIYKPYPSASPYRVERKASMRRIVQQQCDDIRQEKLDEYRAELEAQQKDFFKEKAEKLAFIRKEELECGVTPTVTEEEIAEARKRAGLD